MRLDKYIKEQWYSQQLDRTQKVDKEFVLEFMKKNKDYRDGGRVFRGLHRLIGGYGYVEPEKFVRRSKNTENYYTLIIDNSSYWSAYPKRSRSIICTSSPYTADSYGTGYRVIPKDGAKIGECPVSDFWQSFSDSIGRKSLADLNYYINKLLLLIVVQIKKSVLPPIYEYNELKKYFAMVDENKSKIEKVLKDGIKRNDDTYEAIYSVFNFDLEYFEKNKKLLEVLEERFRPDKNGFKLKNIGDRFERDDVELWISDPCVLVERHEYENLERSGEA